MFYIWYIPCPSYHRHGRHIKQFSTYQFAETAVQLCSSYLNVLRASSQSNPRATPVPSKNKKLKSEPDFIEIVLRDMYILYKDSTKNKTLYLQPDGRETKTQQYTHNLWLQLEQATFFFVY